MNYDRNCAQYILLENQGANIAKHRKYVLSVLTLFYLVPRAIKKKVINLLSLPPPIFIIILL